MDYISPSIREAPDKRAETHLWRASWAEADPQNAIVHHYFFAAEDAEAAQEKVFIWMRKPARPLPNHTRIVNENWSPQRLSTQTLSIWRTTWLEDGEKHALIFFEPPERTGASFRAQIWARHRCETLEKFQRLDRLGGIQYALARFDPEEGHAMFGAEAGYM